MGRLQGTGYQGAFAQKVLLDGVRRDKDVGRFGVEMVIGRAKETEPLFRDFEVTGAILRRAVWRTPQPSWGSMAADGLSAIRIAPHMVIAPSIALSLTLMAFNFLGDGLRDALDPRMRE